MTPVPTELDERFRAAAAATGLLDVAYDVLDDTPVGPLLVGVTDRGLTRISFDAEPERQLETLARLYGPRVLRSARPLDRVRRELDEYFEGRRHDFDLDLDLRVGAAFHRRVLGELGRVRYGQTTTYGALAAQAGNPRAARAVGTVMHRNPIPIVLPCHRVVGSNGSLTGYGGGLDRKEWLLRLEGAILGPRSPAAPDRVVSPRRGAGRGRGGSRRPTR
jgi:methylated-DNA-[protein]-cysteine S-methyltransferase